MRRKRRPRNYAEANTTALSIRAHRHRNQKGAPLALEKNPTDTRRPHLAHSSQDIVPLYGEEYLM